MSRCIGLLIWGWRGILVCLFILSIIKGKGGQWRRRKGMRLIKEIDFAAADALVDATHRYKEIFYD